MNWGTRKLAVVYTRNQPVAGGRFADVFTIKLPVAPWLSMTGMERTGRKLLQPLSAK
jgi:hypothetical protein